MIKQNFIVAFTLMGKDDFQLNKQFNEFMSQAYREFSASYNVMDYIVLPASDCTCGGCPQDYPNE